MQDSVTITSIDTAQTDNGYVLVDVSIVVSGTTYTPDALTVNATDAPSIIASVKQQAESYRQNVLAAVAANETAAGASSLSSLDGTVIDL